MQTTSVLAGRDVVSEQRLYLYSPIWVPSQLTRVLLSASETDGRIAVLEQIAPYGTASPCHVHHKEDELIYVLDGELTVYVDGRPRAVTRGAGVMLPRGREHAFVVESVEARVLAVFSPAGFERLIVETGRPLVSPMRPVLSEDARAVERMVAAAARYECDITGPPPQPSSSSRDRQPVMWHAASDTSVALPVVLARETKLPS